MSTVATPVIKQLAKDWESKAGYASAVCSGVIGDKAHEARGGYHCGRKFNPAGNYSVVRPDDVDGMGPDDASSAIDMTLSTADIKLCTARMVKVYTNPADPRRKYINAYNGWTGTGGAQRWDFYARKVKSATADHEWHGHLELRRRYANSAVAATAVLSALKGESVAAYLASLGKQPAAGAAVTTISKTTTAVVTAPPAFPGVLRRVDKQAKPDTNVKAFQAQLLKRGWTSLGAADGFFGPKLEDVVKRWQVLCGLGADGVIGAKTWPTPWTRPLGS